MDFISNIKIRAQAERGQLQISRTATFTFFGSKVNRRLDVGMLLIGSVSHDHAKPSKKFQ